MLSKIDVDSYPDNESIPEIITQDRDNAHKIIRQMLDNFNRNRAHFMTIAYNKLERLLEEVRTEAIDWAWEEACTDSEMGCDILKRDKEMLCAKANKELNSSWHSEDKCR